jgi:hypothetical protein
MKGLIEDELMDATWKVVLTTPEGIGRQNREIRDQRLPLAHFCFHLTPFPKTLEYPSED